MNHHVKPMTLIKETDYGTPHPEVTETTKLVTLQIDGLEITVPEGTSIMNAAMQLGIQVPKLCATDSLEAFGSCRRANSSALPLSVFRRIGAPWVC